jgi:molecular chaperone HtpG
LLLQNGGQLFGLRSSFGLAPVPNGGTYQLGGFLNLEMLNPTAGREALSRESIEHASRLISMCEAEATEALADVDVCDRNNAFLQHLVKHGSYHLASRVSVRVLPDDQDVQMGQVKDRAASKQLHYYLGRDPSTLATFAGESSVLLHVSQANPRRQVQNHYLSAVLKLDQVPDTARIDAKYTGRDLTLEEASAVIRIMATITDDYLVPNVEVVLAEMSHGVSVLAQKEGEHLRMYIARKHSAFRTLVEAYRTAYEVFPGFVKDYVRVCTF